MRPALLCDLFTETFLLFILMSLLRCGLLGLTLHSCREKAHLQNAGRLLNDPVRQHLLREWNFESKL